MNFEFVAVMGNTDDDHRKKPKPVEDNSHAAVGKSHAAVRKLPRCSPETPTPQSSVIPRRRQLHSHAAVCKFPRRSRHQNVPTPQSMLISLVGVHDRTR